MKKLFAILMCLMLIFVTPLVTYAEDLEVGDVYEGEVGEDNSTPEEEMPTEGEISAPEETPEAEDELKTVTDEIVEYLEENYEWIGVIITIIGYGILGFRKLKNVLKSMGTLNNNAVTIAENSSSFMSQALANIENASGAVTSYDARIVTMLEAFKTTAEDKAKLEAELVEVKNYLQTATQANVEFANELAELLVLANIPNAKKDELYSRHLAKVAAINEASEKAVALLPASGEEVKSDVGEEA